MFAVYLPFAIVLLTGLAASLILTPPVRALAIRWGVVDLPNERRPHRRPTARGGGLAVVIAFHLACLVALILPWIEPATGLNAGWWSRFLLASIVLAGVGLVDDVRGLKPIPKLGGQMFAASVMWAGGLRFERFLGISLHPALDAVLVILWIVAIINAFNLIDGLDGLASGLTCISAAGLCGILIISGQFGKVVILLALIGACMGFLRYNFHPASVFLGDTGSMFLGFTLAVISLETSTKGTFFLSVGIPLLVLGVPIYDELLAVWRRGMRRLLESRNGDGGRRTGVMSPDLDHVHHRLLKAGFTTRRAALALYAGNAVLVVIGMLLALYQSYAIGILLLAFVAGAFVLVRNLAIIELRDTGSYLLQGLRRPTPKTARALLDPLWDTLWMAGGATLAMHLTVDASPTFWHDWFVALPIWVTPTVSILAWSRCYLTVWSRVRGLDALLLYSLMVVGLLFSVAISLLLNPTEPSRVLVQALIVGGLSHPPMLGLRLLYVSIQELTLYFRSKAELNRQTERILVWGAGERCQLFLKERALRASETPSPGLIVGLLAADSALLNQWVYGYMVMGNLNDLDSIVESRRITKLVLTEALDAPDLLMVQAVTRSKGIRVSEWICYEREFFVEQPVPLQSPPIHQLD